MNDASLISVHELSGRTGLSRKTVYYYDRIGLLKPSGRKGKQKAKLYSEKDEEKLAQIIEYKKAGLKLMEIREIFMDEASAKKYLRASIQR